MDNNVRVAVISDIHIGKGDINKLWKELHEVFIPKLDDSIDLLVIAGDLLDKVIKLSDTESNYFFLLMDEIISLAKQNNFKVRLLKGTKSHDGNQLNNLNLLYEDEDDYLYGLADEVCSEDICGMNVLYIPEEYVENVEDYYKDYFIENEYDMVFFHGTFDFAGFAGKLTTKGSKLAPTFKSNELINISKGPIIGGHIHIKDNYKNKIFYTGSFTRTSFGEDEPKGFYIIDYNLDTNEYKMNFIENTLAPEFVTISLSRLEGTLEEKMNKIDALKEAYGNIRIDVSSEDKKGNEAIIDAIKNMSEGISLNVKNSFKDKYDERFEFIIKKELPLDKSIQKFIEITKDKKIDINKIQKFLKQED